MAMTWSEMRDYIWGHGWTPVKYMENGRIVLAWEHKETGRECQDLEDAYHNEHYLQETKR